MSGENRDYGSELRDTLSNKALSEVVKRLEILVRLEQSPAFVMGYCATDDTTFCEVTDYIQKRLGIPPECVLETELSENTVNLHAYFREQQSVINRLPSEIIMVKARGFERINDLERVVRVAHDYDQDVAQRPRETVPGLQKKVIVVTQIGHSQGPRRYELAVMSACRSQFKSFIYQIEPAGR